MDEREVSVLMDCGEGLRADRVRVEWVEAGRPESPCAEARLEHQWQAALADALAHGRQLFNGRITQMRGVEMRGDELVFRLAAGDYRGFFVTCMHDHEWFGRHAPEWMMPALVNSVLLTRGEEALLGVRSVAMSAYGGRAHLIGGVLEELGTEKFPASVEGLLGHLMLELQEEAGAGEADLEARAAGWPRLIAVSRDEHYAQPEAIWRWEARVPLGEIGERMDAAEHAGWVILRRREMKEEVWKSMTPNARHAWRVWSGK